MEVARATAAVETVEEAMIAEEMPEEMLEATIKAHLNNNNKKSSMYFIDFWTRF